MIKENKKIKANGLIQPTNFQDLHSLQELVQTRKKIKKVESNLDTITENVVKSFIMSGNEVLQYVPSNSKYKLITQDYINCDASDDLNSLITNSVIDMDVKCFIVCNKQKLIAPISYDELSEKNFKNYEISSGITCSKIEMDEHRFNYKLYHDEIHASYNFWYQKYERTGGSGPWISTGPGRGYYMGSSIKLIDAPIYFSFVIDVETNTLIKIYMKV